MLSCVRKVLYVGKEIKNQKELFGLLNVKNCSGKERDCLKNNLRRFFLYRKKEDGTNKIIITDIFDPPKEKVDKRSSGNKSKYSNLIEDILLYHFKSNNIDTDILSLKALYELLGCTNVTYRKWFYSRYALLEMPNIKDENITIWYVNEFFRDTNNMLSEIVTSALNSMKRRRLIECETVYLGKREDYGTVLITEKGEINSIIQIEKDVLQELNCKDVREVIYNKDKDITYERYLNRKDELVKEILGYEYVFEAKKIHCSEEYLSKEIVEPEQALKKQLNKLVNEKYATVVSNKLKDNKKGLNIKFVYPERYRNVMNMLSAIFLKNNQKQ